MLSLNNPQSLVSCSLDDLRLAVRAISEWTEVRARLLDGVIQSRVVDALVESMDPVELTALHHAIVTLVPITHHAELRQLDRDWPARWGTMADMLDARVGQLDARDVDRVGFIHPDGTLRSRRICRDHGL